MACQELGIMFNLKDKTINFKIFLVCKLFPCSSINSKIQIVLFSHMLTRKMVMHRKIKKRPPHQKKIKVKRLERKVLL